MWVKKGGRENRWGGSRRRISHHHIPDTEFLLLGPHALLLIGLICGKMHCHYSYPALTARPGTWNSREESVVQWHGSESEICRTRGGGGGVGAVSLRNESDKRKGLGRWAEETGSTLLN